ncbi:MAG: TadE/TadG family type IV pilus assembly protein [Devosia sp.]|jgi:hypothetical protein
MAGRLTTRIGRGLLLRRQRGFVRNERGAIAVEFGLLALPFFSILGAILETSLVFLSGQVLDSAVQDVSRLVRTGQAQQAGITPERYKEMVCERLLGLFSDCNALHIEMQVIDTFAEIDMSPPVKWTCTPGDEECDDWTREESFTPGTGSSIVTVQVYYKWPLIVPFGGLGLGNLPDGRRLMGAASVFRNEPFT